MREAKALTLSGGAHLALLAVLSLSWSLMSKDIAPIMDEPIDVEFVTISDAPTVTERPPPSLAAAPRELVEAEPVLEPLDSIQPEALPDLSPPSDTPPPPEAEPEPEPEQAPPQRQELSAPVDRDLAVAERAREEDDFAEAITDALPTRAQLSTIQQNTLVGLIRERIYKCWDPNAGGANASAIVTTLRVRAMPDGTIRERPTLVRQTGDAPASFKRTARDAAIRAVMNPRCSLEGLPADLYEGGWEDFTLNFDPKDL
ncbi:MAG: hypothetical protein V2J26_04140 [Pacificimonas sp.]|jgi:outer membrane biosynthesis protein TonB|nr:hypothetical protein [Pacificimonas sp.]